MDVECDKLQYLIREHMIERVDGEPMEESANHGLNNGWILEGEKLHVRWNSQKGRIFIDGSHLTHNLELGDEIMIDNKAPPLKIFYNDGSVGKNKIVSDAK